MPTPSRPFPAHKRQWPKVASQIPNVITAYLDRNYRMDHRVTQQALLQEALRLAVSVDEMDVDLLHGGYAREEGDLESVHLMFRVNNAVRETLPREREERSRRMALIMRALCNQIGSEAETLHSIARHANDG